MPRGITDLEHLQRITPLHAIHRYTSSPAIGVGHWTPRRQWQLILVCFPQRLPLAFQACLACHPAAARDAARHIRLAALFPVYPTGSFLPLQLRPI